MPTIKPILTSKLARIVHHVNETGRWASSNRKVLFQGKADNDWIEVCRFPSVPPRDFGGFSRLCSRALRLDQCNLFPTSGGKLLGIRRGVAYGIANGRTQALFKIQGHSVFRRGIAESKTGNVYFGEYLRNSSRGPVNIWRVSADLREYGIAYTFPAGRIRHVHGVYRDPFRDNTLWAPVGDEDGECFLVRTDDEFSTVEYVGNGTQLWRAIGLLFTADRIIWLTDSNLQQNRCVSLDRNSGRISLHQKLDSPAWFTTQTTDGFFLAATTVEKGPGVMTDRASVLISENGINWEKALSYQKDRWPGVYFKFGVISFPAGSYSADEIWLSGQALRGFDGCSLLCAIER